MSGDSKLLGVEVVRVLSKKSQMLMILAEGFPTPADLKGTPVPSVVKKQLKKLAKDSTGKLSGTACLLYTSPSPRDRQKSRMPSSA